MQRYSDTVINQVGRPQPNVSVTVTVFNSSCGTGALASLFSDDGITGTANPVTTDALGRYGFYINTGKYDLTFSGSGITTFCRANVEIDDLLEFKSGDLAPISTGNWLATGNWTFSGSNIHSGTETFTAGGGLSGTITGNPTLSGNPIFSGTPSFIGTGNTGTLNLGATVLAANNSFTGTSIITNLNGAVYLDGVKYTSLATAIAALPSGGTLRISAGTYTVSSSITLVGNLDIECDSNNATIIQASASLNAYMFVGNSISNFRMAGCVVDGNRSGNTNQFGAISLTGVTKSKIIGNHFQNFSSGRIVYLSSGSNFNTIQDNEIDHYGPALPAVANGNECIALAPSGAGAGVQDNDIIHNYCHDGNGGIGVYNSTAAASVSNNTSRNRLLSNKVQAMCNDAFLVFSSPTANPLGSLIQGNLFETNTARCNGWPANGTGWDSTNCPPGLLQTGASAGQGVGFNLNSSQADQNQFIGNRAEFNFFEGGDDTPQVAATVNTSNGALGGCTSNCVQATAGAPFNTLWKANSAITINSVIFLIASVQSATVLTLTTAPGTQTGVASNGFMFSRSIWKGNYFYNNGNGATGSQGSGLAIQGGYVTSSGNIAASNAYSGFYDQGAVYVTHDGDHALFNCRTAACNEFNVQAALNPTHVGVSSDSGANNALFWSGGTNNGFAESASLCANGSCGASVVQDQGTADRFSDGRVRGASNTNGGTHSLCFAATGGTGCVNYGGGAGSFTATLQGVSAPLSNTIASGTAAMTTAGITAGNCGATVTVSASGTLTTDTIAWAFNAAPAGSNAGLVAWPTANNVNFAYCSNTAQTPAAATINWKVLR